jgi:hypothetical protein
MRHLTALALAALLAAPGYGGDTEPPAVNVYPAEIELSRATVRRSSSGDRPDDPRDVTDRAKKSRRC